MGTLQAISNYFTQTQKQPYTPNAGATAPVETSLPLTNAQLKKIDESRDLIKKCSDIATKEILALDRLYLETNPIRVKSFYDEKRLKSHYWKQLNGEVSERLRKENELSDLLDQCEKLIDQCPGAEQARLKKEMNTVISNYKQSTATPAGMMGRLSALSKYLGHKKFPINIDTKEPKPEPLVSNRNLLLGTVSAIGMFGQTSLGAPIVRTALEIVKPIAAFTLGFIGTVVEQAPSSTLIPLLSAACVLPACAKAARNRDVNELVKQVAIGVGIAAIPQALSLMATS